MIQRNHSQLNKLGVAAAVMAISVVQMGSTAISPILADITQAFPEASSSEIQMLMTFPSLFVIVFCFLDPVLMTYIAKKYLAAAGCFLFALSGLLSFLIHSSLTYLYIWTAMNGIGTGINIPVALSLITDLFSGRERDTLMGFQSSASNVGAMVMSFACGLLGAVKWNAGFLVYLLAIPGLALTLRYIPQHAGAKDLSDSRTGGKQSYLRAAGQKAVRRGVFLSFAATMFFNVIPANLSMLISERGFGGTVASGAASTLLLLSGTLFGMAFGSLKKWMGRKVAAFGFLMLTVGFLVLAAAPSLTLVFLGCVISGCTMSTVMPQIILEATESEETRDAASSAIMAFGSVGSFLTPLVTSFSEKVLGVSLVAGRMYCSAAPVFVIGIILLLDNRKETTN